MLQANIHTRYPTNIEFVTIAGKHHMIDFSSKSETEGEPWKLTMFFPDDRGEMENVLSQLEGALAQARRKLLPETIKTGVQQDGDTNDAIPPVAG